MDDEYNVEIVGSGFANDISGSSGSSFADSLASEEDFLVHAIINIGGFAASTIIAMTIVVSTFQMALLYYLMDRTNFGYGIFKKAVKKVMDYIEESKLGKWVKKGINFMKNLLKSIFSFIKNLLKFLGELLLRAARFIGKYLGNLAEKYPILKRVGSMLDDLYSIAKKGITKIYDFGNRLLKSAIKITEKVGRGVAKPFEVSADFLRKTMQNIRLRIANIAQNARIGLRNFFEQTVVKTFKEYGKAIMQGVSREISLGMRVFFKGITKAFPKLINAMIKGVLKAGKTEFKGILSDFGGLGKYSSEVMERMKKTFKAVLKGIEETKVYKFLESRAKSLFNFSKESEEALAKKIAKETEENMAEAAIKGIAKEAGEDMIKIGTKTISRALLSELTFGIGGWWYDVYVLGINGWRALLPNFFGGVIGGAITYGSFGLLALTMGTGADAFVTWFVYKVQDAILGAGKTTATWIGGMASKFAVNIKNSIFSGPIAAYERIQQGYAKILEKAEKVKKMIQEFNLTVQALPRIDMESISSLSDNEKSIGIVSYYGESSLLNSIAKGNIKLKSTATTKFDTETSTEDLPDMPIKAEFTGVNEAGSKAVLEDSGYYADSIPNPRMILSRYLRWPARPHGLNKRWVRILEENWGILLEELKTQEEAQRLKKEEGLLNRLNKFGNRIGDAFSNPEGMVLDAYGSFADKSGGKRYIGTIMENGQKRDLYVETAKVCLLEG